MADLRSVISALGQQQDPYSVMQEGRTPQSAANVLSALGTIATNVPPISWATNALGAFGRGLEATARGEQDPADALSVAGSVMGGGLGKSPGGFALGSGPIRPGAAEAAPAAAESVPAVSRMIKAFHGSPADFGAVGERPFSDEFIGSGEGAQIYGHGHYASEAESVARSYREGLAGAPTPWQMHLRGKPMYGSAPKTDVGLSPEEVLGRNELYSRLGAYHDPSDPKVLAKTKGMLEADLESYKKNPNDPYPGYDRGQRIQSAIDLMNNPDFKVMPRVDPGRMYEVGIEADPKKFLDWDLPITKQPHVQEALGKIGHSPVTERGAPRNWYEYPFGGGKSIQDGQDVVRFLETSHLTPEAASQALLNAGIPGIRYLDQGSRDLVGAGPIPPNVKAALRSVRNLGHETPEQAMDALRGKVGLGYDLGEYWDDFFTPKKKEHLDTIENYLYNPKGATRNYVVFDPKTIEIIRKYGLAAVMGGGAAMRAATGGQDQEQQ